MIDITLVGSSGVYPLPNRSLTAMIFRYAGFNTLVDCGEGTQIALRNVGFSIPNLDVICITHCHADHILGLPGLLLSLNNMDGVRPLTIIAPEGFKLWFDNTMSCLPKLNFPILVQEVRFNSEFCFGNTKLKTFCVDHTIQCFGYKFIVERSGRFNEKKALASGVPKEYWSFIQAGYIFKKQDGEIIDKNTILDPQRMPISVVYSTDTRPCLTLQENLQGTDLAILEGMYNDEKDLEKAIEVKHMLATEACQLAADANVGELWLTHLGPSTTHLDLDKLKRIFNNVRTGYTGCNISLAFKD